MMEPTRIADDMNVGPMSATFKLKKNATFQARSSPGSCSQRSAYS
jgi:hypothetical protein